MEPEVPSLTACQNTILASMVATGVQCCIWVELFVPTYKVSVIGSLFCLCTSFLCLHQISILKQQAQLWLICHL